MKTLLKILITCILVAFCVYLEDYVQRFAGMFAGMAVTCIGFLFDDVRREEWRDFFCLLGSGLYFVFFIGAANGLHFEETENGAVVRSAWWTHIIEEGTKLEKRKLCAYYTSYYSQTNVKEEEFFFVYNGTSCSVYNTHGKIMSVPETFSITQHDYGHGPLDQIVVGEKAIDLRGNEINSGYKPYISDITPDYSSYN